MPSKRDNINIEWCYIAALAAAPLFLSGFALLAGNSLSVDRLASPNVLLAAIVFYPVCEEIIFRGLIQGELSKCRFTQATFFGFSAANCVASLIFAVTHVLIFPTAGALLVFFPGLMFGFFFERHRNLIFPIALHAWYNLVGLLSSPLW